MNSNGLCGRWPYEQLGSVSDPCRKWLSSCFSLVLNHRSCDTIFLPDHHQYKSWSWCMPQGICLESSAFGLLLAYQKPHITLCNPARRGPHLVICVSCGFIVVNVGVEVVCYVAVLHSSFEYPRQSWVVTFIARGILQNLIPVEWIFLVLGIPQDDLFSCCLHCLIRGSRESHGRSIPCEEYTCIL